MEIELLGPLVVTRDDRPLGLGGAQPRLLLALLALDTGRVVGVDRLVDGIWGANLPGEPANALQVVASRLRRALAPAWTPAPSCAAWKPSSSPRTRRWRSLRNCRPPRLGPPAPAARRSGSRTPPHRSLARRRT